jgi:hypothetical protein
MLILSQLVLRGGPSQGGADAVLLKTAAAEQVVRPSLNFVGGGGVGILPIKIIHCYTIRWVKEPHSTPKLLRDRVSIHKMSLKILPTFILKLNRSKTRILFIDFPQKLHYTDLNSVSLAS